MLQKTFACRIQKVSQSTSFPCHQGIYCKSSNSGKLFLTFCIECISLSETQYSQNIVCSAELHFKVICNEIRNYSVLVHSFSGFTCGLSKASLLASCYVMNICSFIHSVMNITSYGTKKQKQKQNQNQHTLQKVTLILLQNYLIVFQIALLQDKK